MNLRFVEAFYWVAMLKSMTRAGEKLCITQSAISSRVAALEEEVGVLLVDRRDKQQFALTNAGLRFLSYAERLMTLHRQLREELGAGGESAYLLRLGAIESVLHTWLIPLIEHLRAAHPRLELELTVEITPVLTEQIKRGNLDLVFTTSAIVASGIRSRALPAMEMVFVGPKTLARRAPYALVEIVGHDLLTFQRGSHPHVALLELLRAARLEPPRLHTVSSIPAMVRLIEAGFGIATLPRIAAEGLMARHDLSIVGCDTELPSLPVQAAYRLDPGSSSLSSVVGGALQFIETFGSRPAQVAIKRARGASAKVMS